MTQFLFKLPLKTVYDEHCHLKLYMLQFVYQSMLNIDFYIYTGVLRIRKDTTMHCLVHFSNPNLKENPRIADAIWKTVRK